MVDFARNYAAVWQTKDGENQYDRGVDFPGGCNRLVLQRIR